MALKRATRVGQSIALPLLCDRDYQAARPDDAATRERLFAESLDVSVLGPLPDAVTRVTIRGMSGRQFQEADEAAFLACAGDTTHFPHHRMVETMRRGLVAVSGFDLAPSDKGFPVEAFADAVGSDWIAARNEIYERIEAWSHLGESAGSSSAPPAGEPA